MKINLLVCLSMIVLVSTTSAQQSREKKLQQLKNRSDLNVIEVEPDLLRLEYPNGKVLIKNIADYKYLESSLQHLVYSQTYDSTIIDLTTIDTTLYYQKYSYWQEVKTARVSWWPIIGDINSNNRPEIYGIIKEYTADYTDLVIMEMNEEGSFDSVYIYDGVIDAKTIYDVDKDGWNELHAMNPLGYISRFRYPFYRKNFWDSLATELYFVFEPYLDNNSQQNDNYFGDWDGDLFTDQVLINPSLTHTRIYEYNPIQNNFDSVYQYDYFSLDHYYGGFSIDDFDQDGKTEFIAGSVNGYVLSIENNGNNTYAANWQGMVETYNAYLLEKTNDIDKNGKKEIWIGGDAFYPGIGAMTRITLFEEDGNDSYTVVGRIDLVGVFSFFAFNIQVVDVDMDGTEEMMLCLDQTVIILKFNGSQNHQTYEVFYIRFNEIALSGGNSVYYGATMYDINNDEKSEIVINMDNVLNDDIRFFSRIYRADYTVNVAQEPDFSPEQFRLYQNHPNPFNPSTSIRFELPELFSVSIKVYNILGKEITTLLYENLPAGEYTIQWDGKDHKGNSLPGGVVLYPDEI